MEDIEPISEAQHLGISTALAALTADCLDGDEARRLWREALAGTDMDETAAYGMLNVARILLSMAATALVMEPEELLQMLALEFQPGM